MQKRRPVQIRRPARCARRSASLTSQRHDVGHPNVDSSLERAAPCSGVGSLWRASAISRYENANYDRYELRTLRKIVEACGGRLRIVMETDDDGREAA